MNQTVKIKYNKPPADEDSVYVGGILGYKKNKTNNTYGKRKDG